MTRKAKNKAETPVEGGRFAAADIGNIHEKMLDLSGTDDVLEGIEERSALNNSAPYIGNVNPELARKVLINFLKSASPEEVVAATGAIIEREVSQEFSDDINVLRRLPKVAPALWGDRDPNEDTNPSKFIEEHYGHLIPDGLTRAHLPEYDPVLYNAYAQYIRRNPKMVVNGLASEARSPHSPDPENQLERRLAAGRKAQARYRLRKRK